MKPALRLLLFIATLSLTACNKATPVDEIEGFDYGTVAKDRYINRFFDIRMDIPRQWIVQDNQQNKALMERGREVASKDAAMKDIVKASEITTVNILTAFTKKPGTVPFNANLMLVAENVHQHPSVTNGAIYLETANKLLRSSQVDLIQVDNSFPKKVIGGKDFYEMNIVMHVKNLDVHQTYLVTIEKGFALAFIYSYLDENQKAEIEKQVYTLSDLRR